jgi:small-conductance mechanosensitive channel
LKDIVSNLSTASGQTLGLVLAASLAAAAWVLLPAGDRRQVRQPAIFLGVHLFARGLYELVDGAGSLGRTLSLVATTTLLLAAGRAAVLLVCDGLLGHRFGRPLPKIIRDIIQAVVYFVLFLGLLQGLGVEPGQLLTTSALLTAAIGLAMQDTLGNLVAGLSVQVQQPFTVGDWVQFDADPKNIGRITEVNWRATTLLTLDDFQVVVPNGLLAKAAVRVYTRPTKVVRRNVYVQAPYGTPPKRVHKIILDALKGASLILSNPPPNVVTSDFKDSGIEYWVRIYIDDFSKRDIAEANARDRIWYAFARHHVTIPFPQRIVHLEQHSDERRDRERQEAASRRALALERVDFLSVIDAELRRELADRSTTRLFSAGEVVVRQGDESSELFIVMRGEVSVVLDGEKASPSSTEREVSRLAAGQFFGEMAMVTGERRKATVKATAETELLVLSRSAFEEVLHKAPEVAEALSVVLAKRQVELAHHEDSISQEEQKNEVQRESNVLFKKIKKLFSL